MKVWRIKLKGYPLYYQPVKGRWAEDQSNLSLTGKVYISRKPSLKDVGWKPCVSKTIMNKFSLKTEGCSWSKRNNLADGYEFEVVEYHLVDINE